MRLLQKPMIARLLAVAALLYALYYLGWRATTLNMEAAAFALLLLAAEAYSVLSGALFSFMAWDTGRRSPFRLRDDLTIDVYVPTYDEDVEILEATLTGCNAITYPHVTYVLDDGRRFEVEALAARLGCRYLTRSDNRHAKAGNLNAALSRTSGDFIVVVDADTIPQPDFLDRTLGYFTDDQVALVQLPQEFFNLDSVQHLGSSAMWHEQELFYRVIQPGKNRWNASFWCGSPSVIRRAALESVGGVATDSVTEDLQTSIRLHGQGWKTVYHDELLAFGIAPQTYAAFALQRGRWAQGAMQILRSQDNPLIARGLTLPQRLSHLGSMLAYFDSYQKLIYLLTPVVIVLTGVLPLRVDGLSFVLHWVPFFALGQLANLALGRGYFRYLEVERFNFLKVFTFLGASATLLWPHRPRFRVTPKGVQASSHRDDRCLLIPHLAMLALIVLAVLIGVLDLIWGLNIQYHRPEIIAAAIGWATFNGAILATGIRTAAHGSQRARYRFPVIRRATLDWSGIDRAVHLDDLSIRGAGVRLEGGLISVGEEVCLTIEVPDGPLAIPAKVTQVAVVDGEVRLGLSFACAGTTQWRTRLSHFLYVVLAARQHRPRSAAASIDAAAAMGQPISSLGDGQTQETVRASG